MSQHPPDDRFPDNRDGRRPPDASDDVLLRVAALTRVDVDPDVARRLRQRALDRLAAPGHSRLAGARRWLEAGAAAGLAASYLAWAFDAVLLIYR